MMKRYHSRLLFSFSSLLCLFGLAVGTAPVAATDSNLSGAAAQSYSADSSVLPGMLVELKSQSQTTVTPLKASDIRNMLGVVVPVNDAPITLTPQSASAQQALVAASGRYNVLASTQDGPIKAGDYIAISALPGIGMKATNGQAEVVGQATGGFNGTSGVISTTTLKTSLGHSSTIAIGSVPISVRLGANPLFQSSSNLPGFLSRAATSIANKPVSPVRVYLSIIILLAILFITAAMFYGGVRSSIVAMGRNPLAKKSIIRDLLQTMVGGLIIFVVGMLAVYLILI
jgi:hypothetical protein